MASTIYSAIGESVVLGLHIVDENGDGLTGQTPTVEIRKQSDDTYLDFGTGNWVSSGGTQEQTLTAETWLTSFYTWTFDQSLYGNNIEVYVMIYRNTDPSYPIEALEIHKFENDTDVCVDILRKWFLNKAELERLDENNWEMRHYEDNGTTIFRKESIVVSGATETREEKP